MKATNILWGSVFLAAGVVGYFVYRKLTSEPELPTFVLPTDPLVKGNTPEIPQSLRDQILKYRSNG